jgi:CBS domain-containing protein
MKAADVMSYRVVTVTPDTTVAAAVELMLKHGISGLPVVDRGGSVVGMVTEGDLLRRAETGTERHRPRWLEFLFGPGRMATEYVHTHGRKVDEVMTRKVITVTRDTGLQEVVHLMERHRIKRLPVLQNDRLVGIVSRANLLPALAHLAAGAPVTKPSDAQLRERVLDEIGKQKWVLSRLIDVVVSDGSVEMHGTLTDDRQREALRVLVENIPGVKKVHDHLIWVEPNSGMAFESPEDNPRPSSG